MWWKVYWVVWLGGRPIPGEPGRANASLSLLANAVLGLLGGAVRPWTL